MLAAEKIRVAASVTPVSPPAESMPRIVSQVGVEVPLVEKTTTTTTVLGKKKRRTLFGFGKLKPTPKPSSPFGKVTAFYGDNIVTETAASNANSGRPDPAVCAGNGWLVTCTNVFCSVRSQSNPS